MAGTTVLNTIPVPTLADLPNIEVAVKQTIEAVDLRLDPIYATTAARASANPSPTAGQKCYVTSTGEWYRWNGTAWISAAPKWYISTSNQTVTDSVTLTNATSLGIVVEASSSYIFRGDLIYSSTGTEGNDMQIAFTIPAGVSGSYSPHGQTSGATTTAGSLYVGNINLTTAATLGTLTSNEQRAFVTGHINTAGSAGTVQLQFAEAAAVGGVTSVTLFNGSHFEVWKVA